MSISVPAHTHFSNKLVAPVVERSTVTVCGRSLAGIAGSNPARSMSVVSVVCCQVEVGCECCVLSGRGLL